jgi:hypothetical protein
VFVNDQVHSQLAAQKIYFPEQGSAALASPEIGPYLNRYAGQQLVTGTQAKAYANHFIAVHLKEIGGGLTYSQLSSKAQADPTNTKLAGQVDTMFRGETLRGLLLNAYAFDKTASIANDAALFAYVGGGVFLVLGGLGLWHSRRVAEEKEFLTGAHESITTEKV